MWRIRLGGMAGLFFAPEPYMLTPTFIKGGIGGGGICPLELFSVPTSGIRNAFTITMEGVKLFSERIY